MAHEVYRQQKQMYGQCSHSVPVRIVSVSQPHVRPIVRGKAGAPEEFGAKISVSKIGRFAFLDRLSWDSYNETADLKPVIEHCRERYGRLPEPVHVDAMYRARYCDRTAGDEPGDPPPDSFAPIDRALADGVIGLQIATRRATDGLRIDQLSSAQNRADESRGYLGSPTRY